MTDSELVIVRGSTPLLVMTVPDKITLSDIADGTITISQKRSGVKIIKKLSEMTFDERNRAYSVFLTQAETLSLDSAWLASIQAKLCDNADVVLVSFMYDVEVLQVNNENILSLDQPSGTAYETPFEGKGIDFLPDLINFQPKIDLESVITSGDYEQLINKPSIGGVTLIGDLSLSDLGAYTKSEIDSTVEEINTKDSAQDTRMDGIDTRIDGVDASIDALDTRADGIDTRIDGVDTRLNNQIGNYVVSRNVESNEYSNSQIDTFFNGFAREIDDLENRIDDQIGLHTLARNVLADEYSNSEIDSKVSAVQGDVDSLETKVNTQLGNYTVSRNVAADEYTNTEIDSALAGKVNTEAGKGLSTNDYTTAEKDKLGALPTANDLSTELDEKVDKIAGKGLSTEDYTSAEKTKLSGIETGAQVNKVETVNSIQPDSNKNVALTAEDIPAEGVGDKTVSGNPITVTDALESTARDLQVEFGPIQDLHGYDHPWAGGAGKNKLQVTATGTTIYGITWTVDSDGVITANGTVPSDAAGNAEIIVAGGWGRDGLVIGTDINLTVGNTYKLVKGNANTAENFFLFISNSSGSVIDNVNARNGETTFTIHSGAVYLNAVLRINKGTTVSNLKVYPMIVATTESSDFEPYSNICPIEGRTGTTVTRSDGAETDPDIDTASISFGQTVYGGQVDFVTGKVRVTHALVDMGTLNWTANTDSVGQYFVSNKIVGKKPAPSNRYDNIICSQYTMTGASNVGDKQIAGSTSPVNTVVYVRDLSYTDAASFKTAMSGVQLCYELATPTELTLTPAQLSLLEGLNILTTDGDNIILTYLGSEASNVQDEIDEFENGLNNVIGSIAFIENSTAKTSHAIGDYVILNGIFCKVIAAISSGETLSFGTNIQATTIGAELRAIWEQVQA